MSALNRKRQAGPSDQINQSKRRAQDSIQMDLRTCCNCSKQFDAFSFISPCCTRCGHMLCLSCPVGTPSPGTFHPNPEGNEHGEQEKPVAPSLSLRSVSIQEVGTSQFVVKRHAQELQPQPTKGQEEVETGEPVKRIQNMKRCQRCRSDKKGCLPVNRVWPTKCERCIEKDFPCSDGKKVARSTKHAPALSPSPTNLVSLATTSASFEELLKQLTFLSSYRSMMILAEGLLKELQEGMRYIFSHARQLHWAWEPRSYTKFVRFVKDDLDYALNRCNKELLKLDPTSQNLPGWFFIAYINRTKSQMHTNFACAECHHTHSQSKASGLKVSQDVCGELLLVQHHLLVHEDTDNWKKQHADLSHEVSKRASAILESFGLIEAAEYAGSIGVYHPEGLCGILDVPEDLHDCLGRSALHAQIDDGDPDYLFGFSELKDRQDILGRTALLIACQAELDDSVERLLEEQADPGLATMYGSLPIHYAAAYGSFDICKQLLAHKTRFNIKAKDVWENTALDYAKEQNHQDVVGLLSAEYAAVDRADEELRRARTFGAGPEEFDVQSYVESL